MRRTETSISFSSPFLLTGSDRRWEKHQIQWWDIRRRIRGHGKLCSGTRRGVMPILLTRHFLMMAAKLAIVAGNQDECVNSVILMNSSFQGINSRKMGINSLDTTVGVEMVHARCFRNTRRRLLTRQARGISWSIG